MLDHDYIAAFARNGVRRSYSQRDTIFYALSASPDLEPLDATELALVLETRQMRTFPTQATVLAPTLTPYLKLDMTKVVHAEQRLFCHRPLPPAGELVIDGKITEIVDKGTGKGAFIAFENQARLDGEDAPLFTLSNTLFVRGAGGFGGSPASSRMRQTLPDQAPDLVHRSQSRPDQALLFRLNGDLNPLHVDPDFAASAGFPRPILHGLCSYGLACRAITLAVLEGDPSRIEGFDVRFAKPFYPGEELLTEVWRESEAILFRCRVAERDVIVLDNGRCTLRPTD